MFFHQRLVTTRQSGEDCLNRFKRIKRLHAACTSAQFTDRLRSAQQEFRKNREFRRPCIKFFTGSVAVLLYARASEIHVSSKAFASQAIDRAQRPIFVNLNNRIAVRLLIDARQKRVQREGILPGNRHRLFDESPERTAFIRSKVVHPGSVHSRNGVQAAQPISR